MYDKNYYKKHEDGSLQSAIRIISYIKTFYNFKSAVDFGCGIGTWCNVMESINIGNCLGIDQHDYSSEYMLISQENYLKYDLRNPLSLTRKYDIAISVEVAEHIDNKYAKIFIGNLCRHSDVILFSAALPNQGGTGHINEQPCSYWKQIFEKYKYRAIDCIRPVFWNDDTIEIWYRNNSILYVNEQLYNDFIKIIPMQVHPLDIVHPEMLARILKKERFK